VDSAREPFIKVDVVSRRAASADDPERKDTAVTGISANLANDSVPLRADAGTRLGGIITPTGLAVAVPLAALVVFLFFEFFRVQNEFSWQRSGDWSHAYMVPLIAFYLLWQRRDEMAKAPSRVFWPGLMLVLMSIASYVFFLVGPAVNHMGRGWSAVLCIYGLVLWLCGPSIGKITFLPIMYLSMGVTISDRVMNAITWPLQIVAAQGAYVLLSIISALSGFEVTIAGNQLTVISSSGVVCPLNVAEACSGMRMVIAFVALGLAVALVAVKPWWQRVLLIVLGVPVALLMNVIRVAVLGLASLQDANLAGGGAHMFIGTLLLIPGFLLYLGIVWALKKAVVEAEPEKKPKAAAVPASKRSREAQTLPAVNWAFLRSVPVLTAVSILAVAAVSIPTVVASLGLHLKKMKIDAPDGRVVSAVPRETTSWIATGKDVQMSEEIVAELGTPNYLSRWYTQKTAPDGQKPKSVELHLAYYTGVIDTVPHVPDRCMVGAGWSLTSAPTDVPIKLDMRLMVPVETPVNPEWTGQLYTARAGAQRVLMPRSPEQLQFRVTQFTGPGQNATLFAGYFFIANGGHVSSPEGVRSLAFELTDDYAYYLKVQISSAEVQTSEELSALAGSLLDELLPEIMRCVPDWADVHTGDFPPDNPRGKNRKK